jgi:hypothetical protein
MPDDQSPYTPGPLLDKLIDAGLGDVEQYKITKEQIVRVLSGEKVEPTRAQLRELAELQEPGFKFRMARGARLERIKRPRNRRK